MASSMLGWSLVCRRAASARSPPAATNAKAAASVFRAALASVTNNGDAAPATGSDEDVERATGDGGPVRRAAEKAADVGGKVKDAAEEVKDAGREVKDRAKEAGQDVKEAIRETR